jgi:hypothetical protein
LCVAAWNVHHVRALASSFVSGDDDYLFILFDGNYKVRASTSPATVLAAAAAIVALLLSAWHAHALCFSHAGTHGPHRSWTAAACAQLLAAGVACDKWQIQKWPFATVSATVARSVVWCVCVTFAFDDDHDVWLVCSDLQLSIEKYRIA